MTEVQPKYRSNVKWLYVRDFTFKQANPVYRVKSPSPPGTCLVWIVDDELMYSHQTEWVYWSTPSNPAAKPSALLAQTSTRNQKMTTTA